MGLKPIDLKTVDLEVAGDTADEVGEAALILAPPGGTSSNVALKYVVGWKKVGGEGQLIVTSGTRCQLDRCTRPLVR